APLWRSKERVDDVAHELLPDLDVRRRVLARVLRIVHDEIDVEVRDLRKRSGLRVREEIRLESERLSSPARERGRTVHGERAGRSVEEPAHVTLLELVEDRRVFVRKRIPGEIRKIVRGATEARRGVRVHAIRPCGPEER